MSANGMFRVTKWVPATYASEFYGDPVVPTEWSGIYMAGQICEAPPLWLNSMSTAIVRIYTQEGFVIAADGRRRRRRDMAILSDTVQKIFPIEEAGRSLAYAMTGGTQIPNEAGEILFDFIVEMREAIKAFATRKPADLYRYGEILSRRINGHLRDAKESGRIPEYPTVEEVTSSDPGKTIVRIYFVGYFEGRPSRTDVRLFHRNQVLASPTIDSPPVRLGQLEIAGSKPIAELLFHTDDPRFASYRRPDPARQEDLTLTEAIEVARNYILACSDPIAGTVDENCENIGGHIHIATVKPDGFRWIIPPA